MKSNRASEGALKSLSLQQKLSPERISRLFLGKAAQEGYLAAIDQGTISLSNFLATILLARSASPTEVGVYGVGFTALRLVRSVQEGMTIQPMNVIGAGMDEEDQNEEPQEEEKAHNMPAGRQYTEYQNSAR